MTTTSEAAKYPIVLLGGGIGAGKSRVVSLFAKRGFDVIEADKVGHDVLEQDVGAIAAVASLWPDAVTDGVVDRAALAQIVFSEPGALANLESITHPLISGALRRRIGSATSPVVVEIPVMTVLADGEYLRVAVVADAGIREDRAVERGSTREDVRRRMSHQQTDDQWIEWADRVVENSGEWDPTAEAVQAFIDDVIDND